MSLDLEKAKRENLRWLICQTLLAAQPYGTTELVILDAIQSIPMNVTALELRQAFDYLVMRELVSVSGKETPVWSAKLTRVGVDLAEYTIDCEAGIARPKKYWP